MSVALALFEPRVVLLGYPKRIEFDFHNVAGQPGILDRTVRPDGVRIDGAFDAGFFKCFHLGRAPRRFANNNRALGHNPATTAARGDEEKHDATVNDGVGQCTDLSGGVWRSHPQKSPVEHVLNKVRHEFR